MDSPSPAMDLEKELTCSICTDLLYQPLTLLDCLHTFCGACLKEWFGWQALSAETRPNPPAAGTPIFTCPACRDAVRSTKHNATVVTLLDMLLTSQPDKRKSDAEKAEMDSKYRPGDNVFPKVHLPKLSAEQQRIERAERRLIDEVREISRQEAVAAATGGDGTHAAREARRRQRRAALAGTGGSGSGAESASDEDGRLAAGRSSDRHRHRSSSRNHAAAAAASAEERLPRIMGHQSSLRSLISSSQEGPGGSSGALDIEREIEAFARQIQEEGILDGLDLDNIDLTNDDELSRRIAEAYQRRQRGRGRHDSNRHDSARREASRQDGTRPEGARHRTSSAVSHHSQVSISSSSAPNTSNQQPERSSGRSTLAVSSTAAGRPPSSSSRTSSRHRSQSQSSHRSRSSTTGARPPSAVLDDGVTPVPLSLPSTSISRPPISNASSHHLEVRDDTHQHHQRRRTASEGRSSTLPTATSDVSSNRPTAHSQVDLPLHPAELPGSSGVVAELPSTPLTGLASIARPAGRSPDARSSTYPTPSPSSSSSSLKSNGSSPTTASFQARAAAMGLQGPPGAQPPKQHSSWPAASPSTAGERSQARTKRPSGSSGSNAAGSSSSAQASQRPTDIMTTTNSPSPPPVASANFALSPVTIDAYELPGISSVSSSQQQHQSQQSGHRRQGSTLFPEPDISCSRCHRQHIEYDLHYNCKICSNGNWNICLDCYRAGKGCQHWFGFGYHTAWDKWEKKAASWRTENAAAIAANGATYPKPHMLTASRYLMPRIVPGGAEGRRTLTTEDPEDRLQSGVFCARCLAWANSCYWRCEVCNEGDWGYCNDCVNQGFSCTHPLLPLTHDPLRTPTTSALAQQQPQQQQHDHLLPAPPPRPPASALFQGISELPAESLSSPTVGSTPSATASLRIGAFRALTFTTTCDLCRKSIPPSRARFHCYSCTSTVVPGTHPGDYDVCQECYGALVLARSPSQQDSATSHGGRLRLMASENGPNGWRRCPSGGHRMVVVAFREDGKHGGVPRRVVLEDLVGGFRLETEPAAATADGQDLEMWYVWYEEKRQFERFVSRDVRLSAPSSSSIPVTTAAAAAAPPVVSARAAFPPVGGVGRSAVARWAYYPETSNSGEGSDTNGSDTNSADAGSSKDDGSNTAANDDELMFPRWAEIREIEDVNGEWYHGVYMGRKGLFPSGFVKMLGD
ncbi:hypothetical protein SEUCBS139899_006178 [Sporothrix eucalyptigena]|uniref:RING-type domain-containing protein n=1 Tax=Sporothrix eucalyptigena TaxID=1812306 RepID=A0ABP0AQJ6_9PEZI